MGIVGRQPRPGMGSAHPETRGAPDMSDEQNEHTEMSALKASMRAVTEERNRLRQEVNTWKESGATWEARDKNLSEQVARLQGELASTKTHHEQDLHLSGLGITSKRGRRAIRREYADAVAEVADGAEAPAFADFVGELREDPLFGRWFSTAADKSVEKSAQTVEPVEKVQAEAQASQQPQRRHDHTQAARHRDRRQELEGAASEAGARGSACCQSGTAEKQGHIS